MTRKFLFGTFLLSTTAYVSSAGAATAVSSYDELKNALTTGGDISFAQDISVPADESGNIVSLGSIDHNTTIDGQSFAFDGGNHSSGFTVGENIKFTLKNFGAVGTNQGFAGFAHDLTNNGGAIMLDKVLFSANKTLESGTIAGGVFNNDTGTAIIKNSVFDNNYAASNATAVWGGIIKNGIVGTADTATMQIDGSTFSNNYIATLAPSTSASHGGVIVNYGNIDFVRNSIFENNQMTAAENSWGGNHGTAIDNQETGYIKEISDSTFRNNSTFRTGDTVYDDGRNYHASAGAIDTYSRIDLIKNVLFEGNFAESVASNAGSGAIMSVTSEEYPAVIGSIEDSRFINNHAKSQKNMAAGGAISAGGKINFITNSRFEGNYAESLENYARGGAINNIADIQSISGSLFKNNYVLSGCNVTNVYGGIGGAIRTISVVLNIQADFIGNYVKGTSGISSVAGGGIFNAGTIGEFDADGNYVSGGISGNFIGNYATHENTAARAHGGAVFNRAKIGKITGVFENNRAAGGTLGRGGALYSSGGSIESIVDSRFSNNSASGKSDQSSGGAIFLTSPLNRMENVIFNGNTVRSDSGHSLAGALLSSQNIGTMKDVTFLNNGVTVDNNHARGGAWFHPGSVTTMDNVVFSNNYVKAGQQAHGGAVYNQGTLPQIVATFNGNSATAGSIALGGALHNKLGGKIGGLKGYVSNNKAQGADTAEGGAIYNAAADFGNIEASALNNRAVSTDGYANGGYIFNSGTLQAVNGDILSNKASGKTYSTGGAIANTGTIANISRDVFAANEVSSSSGYAYGGFLFNSGTVTEVKGEVLKNSAEGSTEAKGGAIYNSGVINITNSSFVNNFAKSDAGEALGGAIYSTKDLNIVANGGNSAFSGNYVESAGVKTANDIYMKGEDNAPINLNVTAEGGSVTFGSGIDGSDYAININGSGTVNFDAEVKNADIFHGQATVGLSGRSAMEPTLNVANGAYLNSDSLTINSGNVNIAELNQKVQLNKLVLNGGRLNIKNLGVNLADGTMGGFAGNTFISNGGSIVVDNIKINTDSADGTANIYFIDSVMAGNVISNIEQSSGPVWHYNVNYNSNTGEFSFVRPSSPKPRDVNPEIMIPSMAVAATVAAMNDEIYSRVLTDINFLKDSAANVLSSDRRIKNAWVKAFGAKDSLDVKDFVGVDSKFYGLIGGLSSDRIAEFGNWSAIYTVYGAYADGEQKFAGEKITNRGGYLGLGANFYNGDFFIGTTINGGIIRNRADAAGVSGKDKFNSYIGGIAVKTGYEYHLGSFDVEPGIYASYTILSADDYVSKSGAKVDFGHTSVIETAPELKVSYEFEDGFKGYASGRYVWLFNQNQHMKAAGFELPDVELEDYAEYGIGLEKSWGDRAAGFVEVKRRDGGREGWNFNLGFKSAL